MLTPTPTGVPLLAQAASVTPEVWLALIGVLSIFVVGIVYLMRGWNDRRTQSLTAEISNLKATATEGIRKDVLSAQAIIDKPAVVVQMTNVLADIFPMLYIGSDVKQLAMIKLFRSVGILNKVVVRESARDGYMYLTDHTNTLFVIIFSADVPNSAAFLDLVMNNDATKNIPVIFIDGNTAEAKLAVYQGGGAGSTGEPLNIQTMLELLNKQGLTVVIAKDVSGGEKST